MCAGIRSVQNNTNSCNAFCVLCSLMRASSCCRHHQGSGPCTDMTFSDYCAWWDKHHQHHQADTQPHQQADKQQHGAQEHNKQQPLLYLKDW